MIKLYLITFIFIIIGLIIDLFRKNENKDNLCINNYMILKSPMTKTELEFCNKLKEITNKYNLIIIPQLQLQKIFKTYNKNDMKAFNKIKSKSIDFAITDNNYNYKLFIELDDKTHNNTNRIKRDNFVNSLFAKYNMKLLRIKVNNNYDMNYIEEQIKEVI